MNMHPAIAFVAAFGAALLSAMGMGGGSILLIYLAAFANVDQLQAQGINLGFFFPVALVAIAFHWKNRLIRWKLALPLILIGIAGVFAGVHVAAALDRGLLSKAFGALLLVMGFREWRKPAK